MSLEFQAIEAFAPRKFHQIFTAPATDKRGPLKITFGIAGIVDGEDSPTILFCGGMFGTRWQAFWLDWMAKREGVRVICVDRPGFGGSTPVALSERIPTFVEVIPQLLAHLKIKYISLASQSAGTIYALNLLSRHSEMLSPTNPCVTFFSPWAHQSHTGISFLALAAILPNPLLDHWNQITGFMINRAQPAFAASGGAISAARSAFKSKTATGEQKEEEERKCLSGYGMDLEMKKEAENLQFKYLFEENTRGANDEARLCLKSTTGTSWHACENYEECVKSLAEVWERKIQEGATQLRVNIILPEEDIMVGEKGMRYFDECWKKEACGKGIDVKVTKLKGTDHDTTASASEGAIQAMFAEAMAPRS